MLKRCFLLALCSAVTLPAMGGSFYLGFDVGASSIKDSDLSGEGLSGEAKLDSWFTGSAALGYRFQESFRVEFNASYRDQDIREVEVEGSTASGDGDVEVWATMVNFYYDIDFGDTPVHLYLGAGIGAGFIDVYSSDVDDSTTEFAWNVATGLSFDATENIVLGLGYRYLSTADAELGGKFAEFGSWDFEAEVDIHEVIYSFRYQF